MRLQVSLRCSCSHSLPSAFYSLTLISQNIMVYFLKTGSLGAQSIPSKWLEVPWRLGGSTLQSHQSNLPRTTSVTFLLLGLPVLLIKHWSKHSPVSFLTWDII